jgi:hypothetical protein
MIIDATFPKAFFPGPDAAHHTSDECGQINISSGIRRLIRFAGFGYFYEPPELQPLYRLYPANWGQRRAPLGGRDRAAMNLPVLHNARAPSVSIHSGARIVARSARKSGKPAARLSLSVMQMRAVLPLGVATVETSIRIDSAAGPSFGVIVTSTPM